ncbi:MAG: hypothetical protein Q8L14_14980 [Myxococcales bacterium]|nr:hypothetical protein [Myxococcales bacterium]
MTLRAVRHESQSQLRWSALTVALSLGLSACQSPPAAPAPVAAVVVVVRDAGVIADALPKKTRGYPLELPFTTGIRVGDHLDVLRATGAGAEVMSSTLLQNCVVVWVDQTPAGKTVVWLLVIPEEAVLLAVAMRAGDVTVTVRNADDFDVLEEKKANLATVENGTPVPSASRGHVHTITVPAK